MTEEQIKEMYLGIINNGEKWECRPIIPCCNYNCGSCNDDGNRCAFFNDLSKMPTCVSYSTGNTTKESEWQPYKLGEGIHEDWEYRKLETWYVLEDDRYDNDFILQKHKGDPVYNPIHFEGTKEECEKWIEEHTKKSWLEEYLDVNCDSKIETHNSKIDIENVCKKILEEVRTHEGIEQMTKFYIGELIKNLGVEV